jgi:hypothetical protein
MKKILLAMTLLVAVSAFATTTASQQQQGQQQASTSVSDATNAGNTQAITIEASNVPTETTANVNYGGTQTVKNVPSVNGPPLTTSNDTCMGSTSGSLNIAGLGIGGGTTWTDDNCKMLKNSRELWNMGMKAAALALMCNDDLNQDALFMTGYKCPQLARREAKLKFEEELRTTPTSTVPSDPYVRARMGLSPLK